MRIHSNFDSPESCPVASSHSPPSRARRDFGALRKLQTQRTTGALAIHSVQSDKRHHHFCKLPATISLIRLVQLHAAEICWWPQFKTKRSKPETTTAEKKPTEPNDLPSAECVELAIFPPRLGSKKNFQRWDAPPRESVNAGVLQHATSAPSTRLMADDAADLDGSST